MRRFVARGAVLAWCCTAGGVGLALAEDKGPVEVVIQSTLETEHGAKPAFLPHQAHQWLECEGCHHGKGANGNQLDYRAGQKIEPCESCHNSKTGMPEPLATLKRAGHALCLECHRHNNEQLTQCGTCHTKK